MSILIVTGTSTGVGKTVATAALATVLRAQGKDVLAIKPVQTGEEPGCGDMVEVGRFAGVPTQEFARFSPALAPNLAARHSGLPQLDRGEVVRRIAQRDTSNKVLLVEGAGGILVRLGEEFTLLDIACDLREDGHALELVVVSSLGLGSLNHAELTVSAVRAAGIGVRGLIGGHLPADPDLATRNNLLELPRVTGVPLMGCLPAGMGQLEPQQFRAAALQALAGFCLGY